jgi:hypothetical protein
VSNLLGQALLLGIVLGGLGVMLGLLPPGRLLRWLVTLLLAAALLPFLCSLVPDWGLALGTALLALVLGLRLLGSALRAALGQGAADHVVGALATDVVRAVLRLLAAPLRLFL